MNQSKGKTTTVPVKPEGNPYMIVQFGYGRYIVPHADGLKIAAAFSHAEEFDKYERTIKTLSNTTEAAVSFTVMSREEYVNIKMKALLGVNKDE